MPETAIARFVLETHIFIQTLYVGSMFVRDLRPPTHRGLCGLTCSKGCPASHTPPKLWHQVLEMEQESTIDNELCGLSFGCITHSLFRRACLRGHSKLCGLCRLYLWVGPLSSSQDDGSHCLVVGLAWTLSRTCRPVPYCNMCAILEHVD